MKLLSSLLNHLLQQAVYQQIPSEQVVERQRFVVFRIFSFTAVVVCLSVFVKMCLTLDNVNWLPFAVLSLGIIILLNYIRVKSHLQLPKAYIIMMASCLVLLHCVAYTCGGIRTGGTFFLMAVIIYGYMLLGRKGGHFLTAAALLHVAIMFFLSTYTELTSFSLFEDKIGLINEDFLTNIVLSIVLISALSSYLQSERNVVIRRVLESKRELELINIELTNQNLALEKKNAELDKFASLASHDLRSPLRAIGSLTDMVLEDAKGFENDTIEKLQIIRKRTHRMDNLLSALLDYSRADRKNINIASIDIGSVVESVKQKYIANKSIRFSISEGLPTLITSQFQIERVFDELVKNAIQFNKNENIIIEIAGARIQDYWQFSVKDNGLGIDDAFKEKVFVIFQTLQTRDSHESAGAGLAIAKKIINENNGMVWITSNLDCGVTFHFTWKEAQVPIKHLQSA
jgi:signal transduction histidine kinase